MEIKGDFLGFEFDDERSESLGIVRTSDGDRYTDGLQLDIKDITAEVPGMDGEYYFGSTYGTKEFEVNIAFDSLTDKQLRKLKKFFGRNHLGALIFDECPYKTYIAKIASPIELSYVCFDEPIKVVNTAGVDGIQWIEQTTEEAVIDEETGEPTGETQTVTTRVRKTVYPYEIQSGTQRIYKGDGTISFVCYFPFAKSTFKALPESTDTYYEGSEDWAVSSGILSEAARTEAKIDLYDSENNQIKIYNAGDVATGFRLYVPATIAVNGFGLSYFINNELISTLVLNSVTMKSSGGIEDIGILIDTNTGLISGISPQTTTEGPVGITYDINGNAVYNITNNIYNGYIASGYLFKLEPNTTTNEATITFTNGAEGIEIFYDYLYF